MVKNYSRIITAFLSVSFLITTINLILNIILLPIYYIPFAKNIPLVCYFLYWDFNGIIPIIIAAIDFGTIIIAVILLKFKSKIFSPIIISYIVDIIWGCYMIIYNYAPIEHIMTIIAQVLMIYFICRWNISKRKTGKGDGSGQGDGSDVS